MSCVLGSRIQSKHTNLSSSICTFQTRIVCRMFTIKFHTFVEDTIPRDQHYHLRAYFVCFDDSFCASEVWGISSNENRYGGTIPMCSYMLGCSSFVVHNSSVYTHANFLKEGRVFCGHDSAAKDLEMWSSLVVFVTAPPARNHRLGCISIVVVIIHA